MKEKTNSKIRKTRRAELKNDKCRKHDWHICIMSWHQRTYFTDNVIQPILYHDKYNSNTKLEKVLIIINVPGLFLQMNISIITMSYNNI